MRTQRIAIRAGVVCAVAVALGIAGMVWRGKRADGNQRYVGVYIVEGGAGYIEIGPTRWGGLKGDGVIWTHEVGELLQSIGPGMTPGTDNLRYRISAASDGLYIEQEVTFATGMSGNRLQLTYLATYGLEETVGDAKKLDLHAFTSSLRGRQDRSILSGSYWEDIFDAGSMRDFIEAVVVPIRSQEFMDADLDPAKAPMRSFLRRIDDGRLPEYFNERWRNGYSVKALQLIRDLQTDHPDDPALLLHRVEMEAFADNLEKAGALWNQWEATRPATIGPLTRQTADSAWRTMQSRRVRREHPGMDAITTAFPALGGPTSSRSLDVQTERSLDVQTEWFRRLGAMEDLLFEDEPLYAPRTGAASGYKRFPNLLEIQTAAKVARVEADLGLLDGRREESAAMLAGVYRLGQTLNAQGILISRLIGIAERSIAIGGLEMYGLNACETPEELEAFNAMLARLERAPGQETGETLFAGEFGLFRSRLTVTGTYVPNFMEATTRHTVTDARWSLLRAAVAGRGRRLVGGEWPTVSGDFAPWLPGGLPADAFDTSVTLRHRVDGADWLVWSIGPDRMDQSATIEYDPTNGTTSAGDILARVPAEREFPFPKGGARADSAAELLAAFPNGLPADPFASVKKTPLSVLDATTTQPVVVFSWGPDNDQREAVTVDTRWAEGRSGRELQMVFERSWEPRSREYAMYHLRSPDGGTYSALHYLTEEQIGNLEARGYTRDVIATFLPGELEDFGIDIHVSSEGLARSPGSGTNGATAYQQTTRGLPIALEVFYDPTNGTVSNGDLFVGIRRRIK